MNRSLLWKLFALAFLLRFVVALAFNVSGMLFSGLSRDSINYHSTGMLIAELISSGATQFPRSWVDDAWFMLIGYIYYFITPEPFLIQMLNCLLGALAAVMTTLMVWKAYGDAKAAYFAGWLLAIFPSFIYFNALLLKDAASLFLMATLGWATVSLRRKFAPRELVVIMACLLGFLGIREYFFMVGAALVAICLLPIFGRAAASARSLMVMLVLFAGVSYAAGTGVFGMTLFSATDYFDLEYINETRSRLDRGTGAIGGSWWGDDFIANLQNALLGAYYFLFSVNPLDLSSGRQYLALPEMLMLMIAAPPLWRGLMRSWKHHRSTAIVLIIFGVSVLAVYVSATTNAGALYRWRMQAFPFLFGILAIGLTVKGSRGNPLRALMNTVTRRIDRPQAQQIATNAV